jgi:predicted transcriptional regulator
MQIVVEILQVASMQANKTRIMYGAGLSFKQMNEYLPHLIKKSLLEYNEKSKTYKTTASGIEVLRKYDTLKL